LILKYNFRTVQTVDETKINYPKVNFIFPPIQRAFTLIELMVVIVIISIVLTFTTLSIGDGGKQRTLQREAERFAALLTLASEQATMQAQELGVSLGTTQYQFWQLQQRDWQPLPNDELLRLRTLPAGMVLTVEIEGEKAELSQLADQVKQPVLMILSSGEMTPFVIKFRMETDETPAYVVRGELTGEMTLHHVEK
jgi:general secretion pathway protein H